MTVVGGSTSDERINEKKIKRNGTLFWEQNMTRLMIEFVTKIVKSHNHFIRFDFNRAGLCSCGRNLDK